MKEIPLTQGRVALVDDEDYEALAVFRWCVQRASKTFYAQRSVRLPDGKRFNMNLHRVVLERKLGRELLTGMECDHDNGDGLDNRRENLFEVTRSQNHRNMHRRYLENPTSQYLGVSWHKRNETWRFAISVNGKSVERGGHETELEAALAREAFIREHPELNARSNFAREGAQP